MSRSNLLLAAVALHLITQKIILPQAVLQSFRLWPFAHVDVRSHWILVIRSFVLSPLLAFTRWC